jgi:hypothetical protein
LQLGGEGGEGGGGWSIVMVIISVEDGHATTAQKIRSNAKRRGMKQRREANRSLPQLYLSPTQNRQWGEKMKNLA